MLIISVVTDHSSNGYSVLGIKPTFRIESITKSEGLGKS
jgi:hypothetical protein